MSAKQARTAAIAETLEKIRSEMAQGASDEALSKARAHLMALAGRAELFPRTDFPLPEEGKNERTFLIQEDEDGSYALYVNSGLKGQTTRPHDHGASWAIVVAVEGDERHRVYRRVDNGTVEGKGEVEVIDEIDVSPGHGICLPESGIHSIHALGEAPLLHLHLYGKSFANQSTRTEYDLENGTTHAYKLRRLDFIEDAR
ncbi:MAG: cysteine dioxygenase family protein [Rhizobiales bacterium]|nr:cysteine dioxygenase family protein [Hyphomicrobiales bacterium]